MIDVVDTGVGNAGRVAIVAVDASYEATVNCPEAGHRDGALVLGAAVATGTVDLDRFSSRLNAT